MWCSVVSFSVCCVRESLCGGSGDGGGRVFFLLALIVALDASAFISTTRESSSSSAHHLLVWFFFFVVTHRRARVAKRQARDIKRSGTSPSPRCGDATSRPVATPRGGIHGTTTRQTPSPRPLRSRRTHRRHRRLRINRMRMRSRQRQGGPARPRLLRPFTHSRSNDRS